MTGKIVGLISCLFMRGSVFDYRDLRKKQQRAHHFLERR